MVSKRWFEFRKGTKFRNPLFTAIKLPFIAIPAAIYRSAPGPGPESAPRSAFWAILGPCLGVPQRVLFECFLAFFGPKNCQKALEKHSLGHSEAGAQNCSKSTPRGTFRPGPRSTPANGGRNRNPFTSILPLFCLLFTSIKPLLSWQFRTTVWNHGLQTLDRGSRTLNNDVFLPSKHLLGAFYDNSASKNPSKNFCLY